MRTRSLRLTSTSVEFRRAGVAVIGGHDGGVRAKPAVAALVGVEGGGHATVEGIRRRQIDATGDG
jgi:hypothetical protein